MRRNRNCFKREKRFLLLMPEYAFGGAETQFRYLIEYAEKHEWKLDVWVEHRFHGSNTLFRKDTVRMKSVKFYEADREGIIKDRMFPNVIKHLIGTFPHIKYKACLIYFPQHLALVPLLKTVGIQVIYSERKDAAYIFDNKCINRNIKRCDWILANSMSTQKKLEEKLRKRVYLINNGKYFVEQLPIKANREIHRILVPARINAAKNQMMLLQFLKDYPDYPGKVIFAGRADNKVYRKSLIDFVRKNDLHARIEFLGYVTDMREEYDKADLVLLPSIAEGTSNVVLEAYAYGRPVIVSDIEPERDIVKNSNLRFSLNDTSGIDRCIKYLEGLSDEEYKSLLEGNRKFVLENYNIEKMAKKFYRFLSNDIL